MELATEAKDLRAQVHCRPRAVTCATSACHVPSTHVPSTWQVETLKSALDEARSRAAATRAEADRAARLDAKLSEMKRSLAAEGERAAEARAALAESREAEGEMRAAIDAMRREPKRGAGAASASAIATQALERRVAEAEAELLTKSNMVVELGTQLREALKAADAGRLNSEKQLAELDAATQELDRLRTEVAERAAAPADAPADAADSAAAIAAAKQYQEKLEGALAALHGDYAALQRERDAMAEEASAER